MEMSFGKMGDLPPGWCLVLELLLSHGIRSRQR